MKYVRIISDEPRFSRMLSLELAELGAQIVTDLNVAIGSDDFYVIADIDKCSLEELEQLSAVSRLIGYSRHLDTVTDKSELCAATLHRPFRTSELIALVDEEVATRRPSALSQSIEKAAQSSVLAIDVDSRSAKYGELLIPLSENEFKVLQMMFENRGEAVSRESIDALLGVTDGNMGDVYICHLRRKIDNKLGIKLIYTVRGKGYMLKK